MTNINNQVDTFPDEWKDEFEGLLFLGKLQREVTRIPFHKFVVSTLTVNDKLEISLLTKPYLDTIGYGRSYKAAVVAAGLISVDGRDLIPGNKNLNVIQQKYDYVAGNWYDAVIDILYEEIEILENRVVLVLQELGIIKQTIPFDVFQETQEETDTPKDGK
jgi:uncharacterized protein YuzB (UPF0349 family)